MWSVCLWPLLWAPSRFSYKSWIKWTSWASQDLPLWKPCWDSTSISWSDKWCMTLLTRMCSNILQHNNTGQRNWPVICRIVPLSLFKNMGATAACRQSSSTIAWVWDWLKMQARTWAISALHSFKTYALRSAGLEALWGFRLHLGLLIYMSSISGYGLGPFQGLSPRVYTDPNCRLNMSAFFVSDVSDFYLSKCDIFTPITKLHDKHLPSFISWKKIEGNWSSKG